MKTKKTIVARIVAYLVVGLIALLFLQRRADDAAFGILKPIFMEMVNIGDFEGVEWVLQRDPSLATTPDTFDYIEIVTSTKPFKVKCQPLFLATLRDTPETVAVLLKYGADADRHAKVEHFMATSPLKAAIVRGYAESVRLLLEAGADVNHKGDHDFTPIYSATAFNHPKVIKVLLDAGADVNARDETGATPLYIAARDCDVESMKVLLQHGADVNARTYTLGSTPLDDLDAWGSDREPEARKLLLKHGAKSGDDLGPNHTSPAPK